MDQWDWVFLIIHIIVVVQLGCILHEIKEGNRVNNANQMDQRKYLSAIAYPEDE